jgi:membrane protein DedA with SNARE-associated domain
MSLRIFTVLTVAGSGVWNGVLIGLGAALGTQYELVSRYSRFLNYVVYAVLAGLVVWLIIRRARRRSRSA